MTVLIKGAGDLASGIACRLRRSGFNVIMTEIDRPTSVRCTVAFSRAVYEGRTVVEDICARLAYTAEEAMEIAAAGEIAVIVDPECRCLQSIRPAALVDAIINKTNMGTSIDDAPIVVGVGPGFTAGEDCHCAVETQRGHDLGRVLYSGSPEPNTGIPGEIGGYSLERIVRAPGDGVFQPLARISDVVEAGQLLATVADLPVYAPIGGVLRGLLPAGTEVHAGMKAGDIDPRCRVENCFSVSDKARAIGGGVLEAILNQVSKGGTLWQK